MEVASPRHQAVVVDRRTLECYNDQAARFAAEYVPLTPDAVYRAVAATFHPGGETVDIGCGSGRDVCWLNSQSYPTVGYDGTEGMLREARQRHPCLTFQRDALPDLASIRSATVDNVLCLAVLMHLPSAEIKPALTNLARILRPDGRLVLSVRSSRSDSEREPDGRLFTPLPTEHLRRLLLDSGFGNIFLSSEEDTCRREIMWRTIGCRKASR
jgi:SAM-dependent methyltransferase